VHPFGPDPARRRHSAAAPRRAPLRCAIGPAGRILGRVASCACAQTLFPAEPSAGTARTPSAGDAAAPSRLHAVHPAPSPAAPRFPLQWITHASLMPHGQTGAQTESGSPQFPFSGRPPPRSRAPASRAAAPTSPNRPGRPILKQRPRLEPSCLDLNRPIQIQAPRSNLTGSPVLFA